MQNQSEFERLVVVETKLDALIKSNEALVSKLDGLMSNYVSQDKHEKDLAIIRVEVQSSKRRSALQVWITSSLAAAFGVLMTVLIQSYINGG